ncbi:MAG: hypothetical protein LBC43_03460 [Bifidobacteriaceae bacterium]|jgi:hypothetical protein|nr:hypothetical protein [Bifidobacteriaceae bacterium]
MVSVIRLLDIDNFHPDSSLCQAGRYLQKPTHRISSVFGHSKLLIVNY